MLQTGSICFSLWPVITKPGSFSQGHRACQSCSRRRDGKDALPELKATLLSGLQTLVECYKTVLLSDQMQAFLDTIIFNQLAFS